MNKFFQITSLVALFAPSPLLAQNMPLNVFLSKSDALQRKGPLALLSSDYGEIKRETEESASQLRGERLAALHAGKQPAYCPPERTPLSSDEVLTYFRSIPASARGNMTTKQGFLSLMVKKYPCRR